jgi:2-amino-4-hydroxy-6-hydroxymethyldihydropteridine diphosphokinase
MILLGLGSNVGEREQNLEQALAFLTLHFDVKIVRLSSLYETAPFGVTDQPDFVNQVVEVGTSLAPMDLLHACMDVENKLGRVREQRWGPRSIDIDILCMDGVRVQTAELEIPHPGLSERRFVLVPICEIAPDEVLVEGKTACQLLLQVLDTQEVRRLKQVRWDDATKKFEA